MKYLHYIYLLFGFVILFIVSIYGYNYYYYERPYNVLFESLKGATLSDKEIKVAREECGKKSVIYIEYYLNQKRKKINYVNHGLQKYYSIRNFFSLCPLSVIKENKDVFLSDPEEVYQVLYGFLRQEELERYFSDTDLKKYAEKSEDIRVPLLIECLLFRYYDYNKYKDKLKKYFYELEEKGYPLDELEYPLMKVLYEKNVLKHSEIQKRFDDGKYLHVDTEIYMEKIGIKGAEWP